MGSSNSAATSGTALEGLAAAISELSLAHLLPRTRECAAQRVYDTLVATALGFVTPEGSRLRAYCGVSSSRAHDTDACCRAAVGATRTTEIDDIDVTSCTTVGAVVVPVAVALAATLRVDGGRLIEAVVAGYEAMVRLGRAIDGATLLYRGVWPTYVTAAFGAAATAARLLDLDAAAVARALRLALARTATLPAAALARPGFRYYALGCAAVDGADAARAAAAGFDADAGALPGFAERIGAALVTDELARVGDRPWLVEGVDTKLWPSSRQALASVAAFFELRPKLVPEDVVAVVVAVPPAYRQMIDRPNLPTQRIESLLGVQYQLALAAFAPQALDDALRRSLPAGAGIADFMARVELRADEVLGAQFPRVWGSRVTVTLRSGEELFAEVLDPPGSGRRPLDWATLRAKHARLLAASGCVATDEIVQLGDCCEALALNAARTDVATLKALADAVVVAAQRAGVGRP